MEDEEMRELSESFNAIMETMDQMQKQIVVSQMGNLLPTGQVQYMRQLVEGGVDELLPPSEEEVKGGKTFYLQYFNADKSQAEGRRLPLSKCVKNPRPDEVSEALRQLGYKSICHRVS
jgi:hypothetical protein